jgi:hypothetical protein
MYLIIQTVLFNVLWVAMCHAGGVNPVELYDPRKSKWYGAAVWGYNVVVIVLGIIKL